jgi:hypothetical protein
MKFADSPNKFCFILLALTLCSVQFCNAEIRFTEHVVSDDYPHARSIMALDIDFDGDIDLLTTKWGRVSLWKNNGEQEYTEHRLFEANSCPPDTADMNGDGEIDIVIVVDNCMSWYENDGDEEFTQHVIDEDFTSICYLGALDLDRDNDIDIFSISADAYWHENIGDQGFSRHRFEGGFWGPNSLYMSDVDNNGYMDALVGVSSSESIILYRNNGDRSFTEHALSERGIESHAVHAVDIDGDNDQDLITDIGDELRLWENIGDNNFRIRTIDNCYSWALDSGDIDGDGDVDLVYSDQTFNWYENEGEYNFTLHRFSRAFEYGRGDIKLADMDNDGDLDVLGIVMEEGLILWFENEGDTLSVEQDDVVSASGFTFSNIYPNPFNSTTTIEYALSYASDVSLSLYNLSGQRIETLVYGRMRAGIHRTTLNAWEMPSGLYFVRLIADHQISTQKIMLIK